MPERSGAPVAGELAVPRAIRTQGGLAKGDLQGVLQDFLRHLDPPVRRNSLLNSFFRVNKKCP